MDLQVLYDNLLQHAPGTIPVAQGGTETDRIGSLCFWKRRFTSRNEFIDCDCLYQDCNEELFCEIIAARILMPDKSFDEVWDDLKHSPRIFEIMAGLYIVTIEAVQFRRVLRDMEMKGEWFSLNGDEALTRCPGGISESASHEELC